MGDVHVNIFDGMRVAPAKLEHIGKMANVPQEMVKRNYSVEDIYPCYPKMTDSERLGCFNSRRPLEGMSAT